MAGERTTMRLRKGDMKIDLTGGPGRVQVFINRDKVTLEKRSVIARRIQYLQHISIGISDDQWPEHTFETWCASFPEPEHPVDG